jgi:hypothetical protein
MPDRGVIVVAYGDKAVAEAEGMIESLRQHHDWPVMAIAEGPVQGADIVRRFDEPGWGARWAKLSQDQFAPWGCWLYLDADTRVKGDLSAGFDVLADGWDVAITASRHQETNWLWVASDQERAVTERLMLSLQGGVFFVQRNARTTALFEHWREEWLRFGHVDQAALVRAVQVCPVRLWLLGKAYEGGELIKHRYGRAVR